MRRAVSTPLVLVLVLALSMLAVAPLAYAQSQTFSVDGTPMMISPDGTVFDGGVFDDRRAPGTGAIAPTSAPLAESQERFDVDCDPDIQVCVDPNGDASAYDDGYDPNAYQQFESALAPYGQWTDDPSYGEVWTPAPEVVGDGFEPYATEGQWTASSDYGYTWVSDYDWGWAPFHYGRWLLIDGRGWSWIPGTLWGPAWVDWRYGNGYCGWSASPPRGVVVAPPGRRRSHAQWHFTLASDLTRRNPSYVPDSVARNVYGRTSAVNNARTISTAGVSTRINLGPPVATVSRDIGRAVPTLALKNGAPSQLPRSSIVAHAGVPLVQRNYGRSATSLGRLATSTPASRPVLQGTGSIPRASAPHVGTPPSYPLGNTYSSPMTGQPVTRYSGTSYQGTPGPRSYAQPAYTAPQPSSQPPAYTRPAYQAPPTYQQPAYQQPAYQPPVQQPAYRQPAYQPPAYSQPTYQAPPAYSQPTYSAPHPSYQAPAMVRPTAPPMVSHPAPAPTFSAPSFGTRRH